MRKLLFAHLAILAYIPAVMAIEPSEVMQWPRAKVESALPDSHPMAYYLYASRLLHEGAKADALFWYYVGELRYRFYLAANPEVPPDGAPALFASLRASVGTAVLENGKVPSTTSAKELQRALDWDESNGNGVTSKTRYAKELRQVRGDATQLELGLSKK